MELLKVVLNGLTSTGPAIQLVNLWRQRGVEPSEFELEKKSPLALSPPSPPPLSLHSLSSSVTPSLSNPSPKENYEKKKRKLSANLVLECVPPELILRSAAFLKAWRQWIENRLQIGKCTLQTFELHMKKCGQMGEKRAIAAIEHSIASSYLSIYEPRQNRKTNDRDRIGASL